VRSPGILFAPLPLAREGALDDVPRPESSRLADHRQLIKIVAGNLQKWRQIKKNGAVDMVSGQGVEP
jgi:hypothetical protein